MSNLKKWLIGGLSLAVAATMAAGLAACSDDVEKDDGENKPPVTGTTEIEWQFTGHHTDETLTGYCFDYYILLNLFNDGSVAGSGYNQLSMDSSAYDKNSGFYEKWWTGSWEETKNSEGLDCIKLNVRYDEDAKNIMGGGFATSRFEYELYPTSEGTITFTLDCPIFSGRQQQVTGSKTVKYSDLNAFIQGNLCVFEEPEYAVMFDSASDRVPGRLYLQEDGTALFYVGNVDPATNQAKYVISQTWSWTYDGGKLVIKTGATSQIEATINGTKATIKYDRNAMGNTISYTMECADISALEDLTPDQPAAPETILTFKGEKGGSLVLYSDNTGVMNSQGVHSMKITWEYKDGKLTVTEIDNGKKHEAVIEGKKATVTYTASYGTYDLSDTFVCNDISAIIK